MNKINDDKKNYEQNEEREKKIKNEMYKMEEERKWKEKKRKKKRKKKKKGKKKVERKKQKETIKHISDDSFSALSSIVLFVVRNGETISFAALSCLESFFPSGDVPSFC